MAKKKNHSSAPTNTESTGKGFATNAFSSLKTLQEIRKNDEEEKRAQRAKEEAEAEARRKSREREEAEAKRSLRFTDEDLHDTSGMTDEEIFAASMSALDGAQIYDKKFNAKELPPSPKSPLHDEEPHLTLSDEEKEFAIFTQEMAISNVQRLTKPSKPIHKTRNKGKYLQTAQALVEKDVVTIDARPNIQESGMKTDFIAPTVAVTQIEKGTDILEEPDIEDSITTTQKQLLRDVKRHEARYGLILSLRLRGLTLNAAMSRLETFIDACQNDRKPYALIICGKGLGSEGAPVIKEGVIDKLRHDARIVEYAPVLNDDGDFGSVVVAFKAKSSS